MRVLLLSTIAWALSACASHSLKYQPPMDNQASTSKVANKSFQKTWEQLVEGLAQNNFVIDSVNKDSGLIVASKKLNPPSSFADCGKWAGHFKNARVDEKYNFEGADSANYVSKMGEVFTAVSRTNTLGSTSNIFVKKVEENKTSISVNSQFSLKMDLNMKSYVYPKGDVYGQDTANVEWTSQDRGRVDKAGQTQCVSKFTLEGSILDLSK